MRYVKKFIMIALISVLVLSSMMVSADAASSSTGYVYVTVTQYYKEAQQTLQYMNKERKKAGLKPVKLDKELCDLAVKRAAESMVYMDSHHTRPNGTNRKTISSRLIRENWCVGYDTPARVIQRAWMTSANHKANLLRKDAKCVGIGYCTSENNDAVYCDMIISETKCKTEMKTAKGTKKYNVKVEALRKYLKASYFSIEMQETKGYPYTWDDLSEGGTYYACPKLMTTGIGFYDVPLTPSDFTWSTSNKLVATVTSTGKVYANNRGDVTITAVKKSDPAVKVTTKVHVDPCDYEDLYDYLNDPYYRNYDFKNDPFFADYPYYYFDDGEDDEDDEDDYSGEDDYTLKSSSLKAAGLSGIVELWWPKADGSMNNDGVLVGLDVNDEVPYLASINGGSPDDASCDEIIVQSDDPEKCIVDNDRHVITFKDSGMFFLTVTGRNNDLTCPWSGEYRLHVTKPLQSITLSCDKPMPVEKGSTVTITAAVDGGRGTEEFQVNKTDPDGGFQGWVASEDELTFDLDADQVGTYRINVSVYDEETGEEIAGDTLLVEVCKPYYPPVCPQDHYNLGGDSGLLADVKLPEGWTFTDEDSAITLDAGEQVTVSAHYVADDKDDYQNTEMDVLVTRTYCKHENTEVIGAEQATCITEGYTGDVYCHDCESIIESGEIIPVDPDNHDPEDLIITTMTAGVFKKGHTEHIYCNGCEQVVKQGEEIPAIDSYDISLGSLKYNGKAKTGTITFKAGDQVLREGTDYTVKYSGNTNAGTATVTCKFTGGRYEGTFKDFFDITKASNQITVKPKTASVKYSKLKKANQSIAAKSAFTVSKAKGKVTYKKASGNSKITVASSGKITVKKGLKKGTYTIKVKVTDAGSTNYKSSSCTVSVKIKVK